MGILELVMIVKNSGQVLQTVLENIKPHIDYWTILDTGSVDGTQDLIVKTMEGKEGKLFQENFTNFRDTRNRSLDLSSKICKYQIILDDTYMVNNGEKLRDFLTKNNKNCYHINIIDNYKNTSYYSNRIIKTRSNKRYERYKIHEAIPDEEMNLLPNTINIVDFRNFYHVERTQKRLEYDLKILYEHFNMDQKDSRIIYYLAVTYQALKKRKDSIKWFKKLIESGNNPKPNEIFEARYQIIEYNDDVLKLEWSRIE
jgi:5S rRNA maturation endonuclease (ribonuclease M5)